MSVAATTSSRPHKQLLYLIVGRFLKYAPEVDVALDLACGRMLIADKVRTRQYIGVDIDEDRLREGITRHPSARAISSTIESLPDDITGDMVFCLQCIGVNKFFKPEHTVEAVAKMVDATRPGGTLLFNVGYNSQAYLAEIVEMLGKVFSPVQDCRLRPVPRALGRSSAAPGLCHERPAVHRPISGAAGADFHLRGSGLIARSRFLDLRKSGDQKSPTGVC